MAGIVVNPHKVSGDPQPLVDLCPFGAIVWSEEKGLEITAACKVCKICVRKGPLGVFEYYEEAVSPKDKEDWKGILVFAEQHFGVIHPVTFELIGRALELGAKSSQAVKVLLVGTEAQAEEILAYGVDEVVLLPNPDEGELDTETLVSLTEDYIRDKKPAIVMVGGTNYGRSFAPSLAAKLRTGLTADCTELDIQPNGDLDQIRPAFGGNVMAHIRTPFHRPQLCTVRYKVFKTAKPVGKKGVITPYLPAPREKVNGASLLAVAEKPPVLRLEDAEVIVVAGRGIRRKEDLDLVFQLAEKLNAQVAGTRPLIEAGWVDPVRQIGLSGRTVQPKLLITVGVSGAIQFISGMKNAETIVAINTDPNAQMMKLAHYAIVADLYEFLPKLIANLERKRETTKEA